MTSLNDIIEIRNALNSSIIDNINALKDDSEIKKYDDKRIKYAQKKIHLQLFKTLDLDPLRFQNLHCLDESKNRASPQRNMKPQNLSLLKKSKRVKFDNSKNIDSVNKRNFYFNDKIKRMF
jgi:hypothetical protein